MSRFYASISGKAQNDATREGTVNSGIRGHIRGWDVGVSVVGYVNEDGKDQFVVYVIGGSNGRKAAYPALVVTEDGVHVREGLERKE